MEILNFQDYRQFVSYRLNTGTKARGSMTKLASAMKVNTSYLSQVLKGERNLSQEQGYFLAKYFQLSLKEHEILRELIALDRASDPEYKKQVQERLEKLKSNTEAELEQSVLNEKNQALFYSSWLYSAIQLITGIPGFQSPEKIARHLKLDLKVVRHALALLVETGHCSTDGKHFFPLVKKTNLPEGSPLMGRHKTNWRLRALEVLPKFREKDLFFTGAIRIDRESYEKITQCLKKAIHEVHESIENADDELLACINIDWFEI